MQHNEPGAATMREVSRQVDAVGRVAFVTGASSGIGAHLALLLARQEYKLVLAARRVEKLAAIGTACKTAGAAHVEVVPLDVTCVQSIEIALQRIVATFERIDVLVNNVGIAEGSTALETSVEAFDAIISTNLRGAWLVANAVARSMKETGGGEIVNIASILAILTVDGGHHVSSL